MSNLIGNALQHGDRDGAVEVRLYPSSDDTVTLSVANPGRIPSDALPHLFDPFRGGQQRMKRADGLGLGLYIAQQIVQAHQGKISVHSGPDARTEFNVEIPRRVIEVLKL